MLRLAWCWRVGTLWQNCRHRITGAHISWLYIYMCVCAKILLTLQLIGPNDWTACPYCSTQHLEPVYKTDLLPRRQKQQDNRKENKTTVCANKGRKEGRKLLLICVDLQGNVRRFVSVIFTTQSNSHLLTLALLLSGIRPCELWSQLLCQALEFVVPCERWLGVMTCWHLVTLCHLSPAAQNLSSFP